MTAAPRLPPGLSRADLDQIVALAGNASPGVDQHAAALIAKYVYSRLQRRAAFAAARKKNQPRPPVSPPHCTDCGQQGHNTRSHR